MTYSKDLLYKLHRLSYANRPLVERSTVCGCFHCGAIYSPDIIDPETDYCIDSPYDTATCPYCWIDSVICDAMDVEITPELLEEMRVEFFEKDAEEVEVTIPETEEEEEPDEQLKSVTFPCDGDAACRVVLQDGGSIALQRDILAGTLELENTDGVSVDFAFPYGSGVVMCLELPDGSEKTVKWNYRNGQLTVCEKGEMKG